jgi:hypothetical protein
MASGAAAVRNREKFASTGILSQAAVQKSAAARAGPFGWGTEKLPMSTSGL